MPLELIIGLLFITIMSYISLVNIVTMKVFNHMPIALIIGYLVYAVLMKIPLQDMFFNLAIGAVVVVILILIHAKVTPLPMGAVKLIGAIVPWIGSGEPLFFFFCAIGIFTGILAFITIFLQKIKIIQRNDAVPFGMAVALAAIVIFPLSATLIQKVI